jgi:hypothetical protein
MNTLNSDEGKFVNQIHERTIRETLKNSYEVKCGDYTFLIYKIKSGYDLSGWGWEVHQNYQSSVGGCCVHRWYKGLTEEDSRPCKTRKIALDRCIKCALDWNNYSLEKLKWLQQNGAK